MRQPQLAHARARCKYATSAIQGVNPTVTYIHSQYYIRENILIYSKKLHIYVAHSAKVQHVSDWSRPLSGWARTICTTQDKTTLVHVTSCLNSLRPCCVVHATVASAYDVMPQRSAWCCMVGCIISLQGSFLLVPWCLRWKSSSFLCVFSMVHRC